MTPTQLDLLAADCTRCQTPPNDCACAVLFAVNDTAQAAGLMPWQTQPRKANR